MPTIRIYNNSVSAVVRSYAVAPTDKGNLVVWLELAPQHPKVLGAIWASLVNGTKEQLGIRDESGDETTSLTVEGLHRRYLRLTADAPRLASRARPKFLRLVAPEAVRIEKREQGFYALEWPGMSAGTALAAMLESGTPYPVRIGWGNHLLSEAEARGFALQLKTGGPAPAGYWIKPAPWGDIVSDGVKRGRLSLDGETRVVGAQDFQKEAVCQPSASSLAS